jgi:hypothetical protein
MGMLAHHVLAWVQGFWLHTVAAQAGLDAHDTWTKVPKLAASVAFAKWFKPSAQLVSSRSVTKRDIQTVLPTCCNLVHSTVPNSYLGMHPD